MDPAHGPPSLRRSRPRRLILAYARSRPGRLLDLVDAAGESGRLALWQHLLHDLGPDPDTVACAIETWRRRPVTALLEKNGLVFAFLVVGLLMVASNYASAKLTRGRLQGSALAEITSGWSPTAP